MAYSEHFGYKSFDGQRRNQMGVIFEEGKIYTAKGNLRPGMYDYDHMNGYHMSEPLANVFRFFDSKAQGIEIAEVRGFGNCLKFDDEYNGYFDMYVCENLEVLRFMRRYEYVEKMLHQSEPDILKFISTFDMDEHEKRMFSYEFEGNKAVSKALAYYQYGDKEVYEREAKVLTLKR